MKRPQSFGFTLSLILIAGLVLSGCSKQEVSFTKKDHVGVFTLLSVNGNVVPASVSHDGVSLQVRSGSFTINADGTCSSITVFVPPTGTELTREVAATYTIGGSSLTMQWEGAGQTVGTIQGDTFTMDNEGMVFVYKK